MPTAAECLDIEKAFDTTQYPGLLYKRANVYFSHGTFDSVSSFLSDRRIEDNLETGRSTSKETQVG